MVELVLYKNKTKTCVKKTFLSSITTLRTAIHYVLELIFFREEGGQREKIEDRRCIIYNKKVRIYVAIYIYIEDIYRVEHERLRGVMIDYQSINRLAVRLIARCTRDPVRSF